MKIYTFLFVTFIWGFGSASAQDDFYLGAHVPEIKFIFAQENWDELLDALFVEGQNNRLQCDLEIDGELLTGVGVRYKGFSSASVDRDKNPFNIKLDYTVEGQNYQGRDKIKLSNVIRDPSFVREVLSYEIARKYMPSSQANFAKVYINDVYWGLYSNVESVENEFLVQHFNEVHRALVKGAPEDLNLFGENANLSNSPGAAAENYYPLYDLKSDDGWEEFIDFIQELNTNPTEVANTLNIDRTLWMHAFNYALVNFDSYIGYAQNYYVYQDENGQFNPIIWDLNQSFGSFRLTDASENFDGFSIAEAKTIDPLLHINSVSVFDRPLMRNLFENATQRRMFMAHLRTIVQENFANENYIERANFYQSLIDADVLADTNKFYSYADFHNNLNSTASYLEEYPGITDLMAVRSEFLLDYAPYNNEPAISVGTFTPENMVFGEAITFSYAVSNAESIYFYVRPTGNGLFERIAMNDSGTNGDATAGDGIYSATVANPGNALDYYVYAENEDAGKFLPARAAYAFDQIFAALPTESIVINELMSANSASVADPSGDYDDWIEFHNLTNQAISVAGLYLTDDATNPTKWEMPNASIPAQGYLIVWADEQSNEGAYHANFQLSSLGEYLSLRSGPEGDELLDELTFGALPENQSLSRFPNGTGPFVAMNTTFGESNLPTSVEESAAGMNFTLWPNPSLDYINISLWPNADTNLQLFGTDGRLVLAATLKSKENKIDVSRLSPGVYTVRIGSFQHKLIKR